MAWATAVVLLSNPWFLNFSRHGWENIHVGTYWLLFTWGLFSGLRAGTRRWLYHLGAGIGGVPTDRPPFHWALVPPLLIGMIRALLRWRVGLWWWLLLLVPIIATQGFSVVGDPDLARMAPTCVAFFWFIGYGAGAVADLANQRWRCAAGIILAAGAIAISGQEWRFFEQWMLSPGVANARGGGVDYRDYARWREIQFRRIAAGKSCVPVVEWERPEIREALLRAHSGPEERADSPDQRSPISDQD